MLMLKVLWAFLSVGILGGLLGLGLAVASKFLAVKRDARLQLVEDALPGLNCGACGFAGCGGYAEAMVTKDAEIDLCKPGGSDALSALGEILGKEIGEAGEKLVAQVRCRGGVDSAEYKYEYTGVQDCNAAVALYGGPKVCPHGCLGFGSCIKVCPVDAIFRDDQNLVRVDRNMCISCGKCVDVCPTGVMQMIPYRADVFVACNSTDKGGAVRKYCSVGCIGCKICVKKSPEGGFEVVDFLARIDYDQDGDREQARDACPTKCIVRLTEDEPEAAEPAVSQAAHVED